MARQTLSAEERKSILEDWQKSGLAQAEYCRKKGLNTKTFSSWKGMLLDTKTTASKAPAKSKTKAKPKKKGARKTTVKPTSAKPAAATSPVVKAEPTNSNGMLVATLPNGVEVRYACDTPEMLTAAINTLAKIK